MDRSVINMPSPKTRHGSYYEESGTTPDYEKRKMLGPPLPILRYTFDRFDAWSDPVMTYNGLKTELDANAPIRLDDMFSGGGWRGLTTPNEMSGLLQRLESGLRSRYRSKSFDLGIAVAETRETAKLFRGTLDTVSKSWKDLKDSFGGSSRQARRNRSILRDLAANGRRTQTDLTGASRDVAGKYLGWVFGVLPLVDTVLASCQALAGSYTREANEVYSVYHSETHAWYYTRRKMSGNKQIGFVYAHLTGKSTAEWKYQVESPALATAQQLGLTNPLELVWEIIPLSFVVDWFLPVGSMIQNLQQPLGVKSLGGYTYFKAKGQWWATTDLDSPGVGWHTKGNGRNAFKRRRLITGFPSYTAAFPDRDFTFGQLATSVALFVQRMIP